MTTAGLSSLSSKQRGWLLVATFLPLAVVVAVWFVGLLGLAKLAVVGAAGAAFLIAVLVKPRWGVYFMAFYVYSGLAFYVPGLLAAAVMATLLVAAALEILRDDPGVPNDAVFWSFVALFAMLAIQSMLVAYSPERSIERFLAFLRALALTWLIVHYVRTPNHLRQLALIVFAGTVATIAFGLINLKLGLYEEGNVLGGLQVYRFSGAHPNPNRAAAIMCSALPLGVYAVFHTRSRLGRVLSVAGLIALVVGIFATFSRSVVIAFALVTAVVVLRETRSRRGYVTIAALFGLAILLTPGYYWSRLQELWQVLTSNIGQDFSVQIRYDALTTAWGLLLDHPWTGVGLGNFIVRGATDVVERIVVHNTFLEIAVGTGFFGLVAFLGIFASGLRHAAGSARRRWSAQTDPDGFLGSLAFYLGVSMVSIMISGLFGSMAFIYPFWVPVAGMLVVGNLVRQES
jgi:O-antigen ligase